MSDLEWYLDVGGKQSGPHTAKEIVEMVRGGKISASSQVTAARMNGDWVTAQDLIDAYDELYTKPKLAAPVAVSSASAFTATSTDPNYTAPPRPTEQLEKSKIITLNREELDRTPDPTEALFQAIQAVREKANQKGAASAPTPSATSARDSFGQLSRPADPRATGPLILILTLAAIFGITVYGIVHLMNGKKTEEATKAPPATRQRDAENSASTSRGASGGLLKADGSGSNAARTTPPVQPMHPTQPTRVTGGHRGTMDERMGNTKGGGARYRDDRDEIQDSPPVDEMDSDPNRDAPVEPSPVDPSQIPADRMIPDPGSIPGRGALPGADPYIVPPPPSGAQ
jgi:hypothetical protein